MLWREAEAEWVRILCERFGYAVIPTSELTANTSATRAPMLRLADGLSILPDAFCLRTDGQPSIWTEVKSKSEPGWFYSRRRYEHGIDLANWREYCRVQTATAAQVYIVVREMSSPVRNPKESGPIDREVLRSQYLVGPPMWLFISVDDAETRGHGMPNWPSAAEPGRGGGGWLWPRGAMTRLNASQGQLFGLGVE